MSLSPHQLYCCSLLFALLFFLSRALLLLGIFGYFCLLVGMVRGGGRPVILPAAMQQGHG